MIHPDPIAALPADARLRAGTAARLAGLPVTTLRVWERRYQVVSAPKTASGQRLYAVADVARLRLLRLLTEQGLSIGSIATLGQAELEALLAGTRPAAAPAPVPGVGVVGRLLAQRLPAAGLRLVATADDLDAAETHWSGPAPDLLLLQLPSLLPDLVPRVLTLHRRLGAHATLVLYGYGAEALADGLRSAGLQVHREPLSQRELARLVLRLAAAARADAGTQPGADRVVAPGAPSGAIRPRRYDDHALSALADLPTHVACECPRHLAELVTRLAGFERYSGECQSRSPADAALHRQLADLAGAARMLMEDALTQVMVAEGLAVPVASPPA